MRAPCVRAHRCPCKWAVHPGRGRAAATLLRRQAKVHCQQASSASATYESLEKVDVDLTAFPTVEFFQVSAVIRPWRLSGVVKNLDAAGVRGLTVYDVSGIGFQGGKERYGGAEFGAGDLITKKKIEVVCIREQVNTVAQCIAVSAYTGEIGDGKIFVAPVCDVVRIRTGETGGSAERMAGGRSDLLSSLE